MKDKFSFKKIRKHIEMETHRIILENSDELQILDDQKNIDDYLYHRVFKEIKIAIYIGISKAIKNNKAMNKQVKKLKNILGELDND